MDKYLPSGPPITGISKLRLKSGDVLAVTVEGVLSLSQISDLKTHVESELPAGIKVLVLDRGARLQVLQINDSATEKGA
jgi:hypothetical protein